jgi:hypothetical protein
MRYDDARLPRGIRTRELIDGKLPVLLVLAVLFVGCQKPWPFLENRYAKIPGDAVKGTPATDPFPPFTVSSEWEAPMPMPGPVNTAGGEDSPFITPDGQEFYFFFTPDVRVPVEKQILDSVTGMWQSRLSGGQWAEPERVVLSDDISLDGCQIVFGDTMWFASVRTGNYGEIDWYIAVRRDGEWCDWRNAGRQVNETLKFGELHLSSDHQTMYFHKQGQYGGLDIWKSGRTPTGWGTPENLGPFVNSSKDDGWPYLSSDGRELFFTGWSDTIMGPCIYRCQLDSTGNWGPAELIVARFAGEPTLDDAGNLYFTHHFYTGGSNSTMLEADIYFCKRK